MELLTFTICPRPIYNSTRNYCIHKDKYAHWQMTSNCKFHSVLSDEKGCFFCTQCTRTVFGHHHCFKQEMSLKKDSAACVPTSNIVIVSFLGKVLIYFSNVYFDATRSAKL